VSTVDWASLIADDKGRVSYPRLKSLVAIVLAFLGALVAIAAGAIEVLGKELPSHDAVLIAVGALVLPLTGGVVANGLQMRKAAKESE
jgi:hypothetical protein